MLRARWKLVELRRTRTGVLLNSSAAPTLPGTHRVYTGMNPYAHHLYERNLDDVLSSTPAALAAAASPLTPEEQETPIGPGKWSPRQILAHMADCELAFSFRLRQMLAGADPGGPPLTIQPFDQDAWATRYFAYDTDTALRLFTAAREWNLKLLTTVEDADLKREGFHPERGLVTFQVTLETIAGHDLNHLKQLQAVKSLADAD